MDVSKIVLELTMREAILLARLIRTGAPGEASEEMIAVILYSRIEKKIEEAK